MSGKISPQLTHAGLWVWDLTRMEDFYTRVLGLSVSDRGYVERYQGNIVFLSANAAFGRRCGMFDMDFTTFITVAQFRGNRIST